jgi:hypothetical protein
MCAVSKAMSSRQRRAAVPMPTHSAGASVPDRRPLNSTASQHVSLCGKRAYNVRDEPLAKQRTAYKEEVLTLSSEVTHTGKQSQPGNSPLLAAAGEQRLHLDARLAADVQRALSLRTVHLSAGEKDGKVMTMCTRWEYRQMAHGVIHYADG